jgi:hypothetical protein
MPVPVALAGRRALAADVDHAERVHLAGIGDPDGHAVLLHHLGVGGGRLHPPELDGRPLVLAEVRQHGTGRERQRRAGADLSGRLRDVCPVGGDQGVADAVVGSGAIEIGLDHADARGAALLDGLVDARDRDFLDAEGRLLRVQPAAGGGETEDGRGERGPGRCLHESPPRVDG